MYGHVEKLAEEIKKGASSVEGVEAKLWQVHHLRSSYCAFVLIFLQILIDVLHLSLLYILTYILGAQLTFIWIFLQNLNFDICYSVNVILFMYKLVPTDYSFLLLLLLFVIKSTLRTKWMTSKAR